MIRRTASALLERAGYSAVCCADGAEAVAAFQAARSSEAPFDCVILDLTVRGGMGGIDAVREIRRIDATVPVLVASGYSDDAAIAEPLRYGFTAGITKPFTRADLVGAVSRHTGAGSGRS
jgi:CheY-like chemotaxis protein